MSVSTSHTRETADELKMCLSDFEAVSDTLRLVTKY